MNTFLHQVAASLLSRFGSNMSQVVVVFPGKRASLFLNQRLAELSPTPVWTPVYRTISELFSQQSPYALCDTVESVCRLYRSYARLVDEPQSLDQFYGWGEVLLSDFDDVDKHLVDARQLFTNIRDIKALEDNSFITPEQEEALRSFFSEFSIESNSLLKERFLLLWNRMFDIYEDFRAQLRTDGMYYEGALQRDVIERLRAARLADPSTVVDDAADLPFANDKRQYVFVGFNVLNEVEKALFDELQHQGRALFYWDYDLFYANPHDKAVHEAGYFIRQNIERYGNELDVADMDNFCKEKQLTIVTASSENAQARFVPQWLEANLTAPERAPEGETYVESQTAVVLCNEQLLQPVLHSLPSSVKALNVTMGFPLSDTSVYSFVNSLMILQTEGLDTINHRFRPSLLAAVENHPFARLINESTWKCEVVGQVALMNYLLEVLTQLGKRLSKEEQSSSMTILLIESVFVAYKRINRILDLMTGDDPLLVVNSATLLRLVRSVLQTQTVPFHGEPAVGLQVMGVLETRALDFRHLLMLSVGEGYLPKSVADNSFIPYHLKDAFGLTTIRHKIAVYAYYFYRLIQRAERVTFVYNESNVGTRQNEGSRFLRQLLAETSMKVEHLQLQASSSLPVLKEIVEPKTDDVMQLLYQRFDNTNKTGKERRILSPSAINLYTTCQLQFYYHYVQGLRVEDDPADGFTAALFGEVFHRAAELLYRQLTSAGMIVRQQDIDEMLANDAYRLDDIVRQAFRDRYFLQLKEEYTGILVIARRVMKSYLKQLLRYDRRLTPIRIIGLEETRLTAMSIESGNRIIEVDTGGIIDRLDEVNDSTAEGGRTLRVVDYKTGGSPASIAELSRLFSNAGQNEHYYLQTILYASIVAQQEQQAVAPCLFYIHKSGAEDYSPLLKLSKISIKDVRQPLTPDGEPLYEAYTEQLKGVIGEIFDPEVPFRQTSNKKACRYCDYRLLCGR